MKKIVRLSTTEDLDFIYDALREDLAEQGVLHRFRYSKNEFKNAIFSNNPLGVFLTLMINNQPAGFANYSIDNRNFTVNIGANLYINDLFVKKSYRRLRGATLLMEKLQEIAKQEQCARIECFVLADNIEALIFYEKFLKLSIISDKLHYMRLELAR